jgi:hypothetical protein
MLGDFGSIKPNLKALEKELKNSITKKINYYGLVKL